jgi:DhnA family fructose-bisphosphate aldolase class Ia
MPEPARLGLPAVVLAADHRARGVVVVEHYRRWLDALLEAMPHCQAVMASPRPLDDLAAADPAKPAYLSVNRTGLAGSAFELDDRLIATPARAKAEGRAGVKHMCRIDLSDPASAGALELLGRVLEEAAALGLDAMVEPLAWSSSAVDRSVEAILLAAVVAHDMGAPLLKVPVPDVAPGGPRVEAVARVTQAVSVPVLFLGGPYQADRSALLSAVADAMAGGAAGMAIGRSVYQDPDPGLVAALVADLVHGRASLEEVTARARP